MKLLLFLIIVLTVSAACCPCPENTAIRDRFGHRMPSSYYTPTGLDSLLLDRAWDVHSCPAMDSFFQLWEEQSEKARAERGHPLNDTMFAAYELFLDVFQPDSEQIFSKYIVLQDSIQVLVVDNGTYDTLPMGSAYDLPVNLRTSARTLAFRPLLPSTRPVLVWRGDFWQAVNYYFNETDGSYRGGISDINYPDSKVINQKERLIGPYLPLSPFHRGFGFTVFSYPIIPAIMFDCDLKRARVYYEYSFSGGMYGYELQGSAWTRTGEGSVWIE